MDESPPRRVVTAHTIRPGQTEAIDRSWLDCSVEERINAVWMLTQLCLDWTAEGESRLQRSVVRIQRPSR